MAEAPRLTRSEDDRMIAGVCGGLAAHYGIDATVVRLGFVLLTLFGASGIMLYLVLWLIVPRGSSVELSPRDAVRDSVDEGRQMARDGADAVKRGYRRLRRGSSDGGGPTGGRPGGDGPAGS
jgi:phage shock protein C